MTTEISDITTDQIAAGQRAYELDREHVFHSWQAQGPFTPMTILKTEGSYVWDGEGNKLIDLSSQLVNTNIGHQHPKVIAALQEQAGRIATIAPQHVNVARSEAASGPPETWTRSSSPTAGRMRWSMRCAWRGCTPAGTRCSPRTAHTTAAPTWR